MAKAKGHFQQYRAQLALSNNHLALLHEKQGSIKLARSAFQEAISLQREILAEQPGSENGLRDLAATLNNLSFFYAKHEPAKANRCYQETLRLQQQLTNSNPDSQQYQNELALTHSNFGAYCSRQGRPQLAVAAYGKAIRILERLHVSSHDDATSTQTCTTQTSPQASASDNLANDLAVACNNLGLAQDALGDLASSEASFHRAIDVLSNSPLGLATPADASRLAGIYSNLGMAL